MRILSSSPRFFNSRKALLTIVSHCLTFIDWLDQLLGQVRKIAYLAIVPSSIESAHCQALSTQHSRYNQLFGKIAEVTGIHGGGPVL